MKWEESKISLQATAIKFVMLLGSGALILAVVA